MSSSNYLQISSFWGDWHSHQLSWGDRLQPKPEQSRQQPNHQHALPRRTATQPPHAAPNRLRSLLPEGWFCVASGSLNWPQVQPAPPSSPSHETYYLVPLPHSPSVPVTQKPRQIPSPGTSSLALLSACSNGCC